MANPETRYRLFWCDEQQWYAVGRARKHGGGCVAYFYMDANRAEARLEAKAFADKLNGKKVRRR